MIRQRKMRTHSGSSVRKEEGGAISLLVAISLGLLASLASF